MPFTKHRMSNLDVFLNAVERHAGTENMYLDLTYHNNKSLFLFRKHARRYHSKDMIRLAKVLASGDCLSGLTIDLTGNEIGNKGIEALALGIGSKNRPRNLTINLTGNRINDKGFFFILDALIKNSETPGLSLILCGTNVCRNLYGSESGGNQIGYRGILMLTYLIKIAQVPPDFSLDLSHNSISNNSVYNLIEALTTALKNRHYCQGLRLNLKENNLVYVFITEIEKLLNQHNQKNEQSIVPLPAVDSFHTQPNASNTPMSSPSSSISAFSILNNKKSQSETLLDDTEESQIKPYFV